MTPRTRERAKDSGLELTRPQRPTNGGQQIYRHCCRMPREHKNWDHHVAEAEDVARGEGFRGLRERIVHEAAPRQGEIAVDVGAGTGLLALAIAPDVEAVWAIDISPAMTEYLRCKAVSGHLTNVRTAVGSAVSLPLVDGCADLVISNYCFHHLSDRDKERALAEVFRVLRPGGRLVLGDMMFRLSLVGPRNRGVLGRAVVDIARRGPAGLVRLLKNGVRLLTRRWEHPAPAHWWEQALLRAGFAEVKIEVLEHEGGIASARRPLVSSPAASTLSVSPRPDFNVASGQRLRPAAPDRAAARRARAA